jgi:flagellar M-ring protein FliF
MANGELAVTGNPIDRVPGLRQLLLLIGVAAAVAGGVAAVLWSQGGAYQALPAELDNGKRADVIAHLESIGVPFRLSTTTGALEVPRDEYNRVRSELLLNGIVDTGFSWEQDVWCKDQWACSARLEEEAIRRALESYLAGSIALLRPVQNARVHLAIPKMRLGRFGERGPSASVYLRLAPGQHLNDSQISGIASLVAAGVPGLVASRVAVVDDAGNMLNDAGAGGDLNNRDLKYRREYEAALVAKIEDVLAPAVGQVRATAHAELDFTTMTRVDQQGQPDPPLLSQHSERQTTVGGAGLAAGVPGSLVNQPPETVAQPGTQAEADAALPRSERTLNTSNYQTGQTVTGEERKVPLVRRLSVSVLLDYQREGGDAQAYSEEEMARFSRLVQSAIGFDELRGDLVTVEQAPFRQPAPVGAPEEPPFWQQPLAKQLLRQGSAAVLVILLGLLVVRPLMRSLLRASRAPVLGAGAAGALPELAADRVALGRGGAQARSPEERMLQARSVVSENPRQVARVVTGWVAEDG